MEVGSGSGGGLFYKPGLAVPNKPEFVASVTPRSLKDVINVGFHFNLHEKLNPT